MADHVICYKCKDVLVDSEENYTTVSKSFDDHTDSEDKVVERNVFVCKKCFNPE